MAILKVLRPEKPLHISNRAVTFLVLDTLEIADRLKASGLSESSAKAVASELLHAQEAGELVTVPKLEAALAKLKHELIWWVIGTGAVSTIVQWFHR